jgi:ATP adenylyltransferase
MGPGPEVQPKEAGDVPELLWAPWRMEFIGGEPEPGCLFCRTGRPGGDDGANLVLWRGPSAFVIMNRFPYSNGHLMVAPYRHGGALGDLTRDEAAELLVVAGRCCGILQTAFRAEGFNVGFNLGKVAGAGVSEHLHLHVVPRWSGDTNFLPVLGETRVMPEYLEVTFGKLAPHFRAAGT